MPRGGACRGGACLHQVSPKQILASACLHVASLGRPCAVVGAWILAAQQFRNAYYYGGIRSSQFGTLSLNSRRPLPPLYTPDSLQFPSSSFEFSTHISCDRLMLEENQCSVLQLIPQQGRQELQCVQSLKNTLRLEKAERGMAKTEASWPTGRPITEAQGSPSTQA